MSSTHGPLRELHIVPHGGTEVPQELLDEIDPEQFPTLAELVHANADTGTGAIYRTLVEGVTSGDVRGIAVAGFHLSRILLDANRLKPEEQVLVHPYSGDGRLYSEYLIREAGRLREEALLPWLRAVDGILCQMQGGVVYHHHTYDLVPLSPRPWDQDPGVKRPAFQLSWRKSNWDTVFEVGCSLEVDELAPLGEIEQARDRIGEFLCDKIGATGTSGAIDHPLLLPVLPFRGTRRGEYCGTLHHVVYDLRKDFLVTEDQVRLWVRDSPWRLAGVIA
ncbi:MAG: hypothetical protein ACRDSH_00540 [Pseudonocardiaceae bacterium]